MAKEKVAVLSADKTKCTIGDITIKVQQSIDYVSAIAGDKASIGRIFEFKYAGYDQQDKESVWMNVADAETGKKEWLSVNNWNGTFTKVIEPVKNKPRGSKKPKNSDLPF